jgi:hypothetical protein
MHAFDAVRKSRAWHQKINGRVHTACAAVAAIRFHVKRDGGDDGDGGDDNAARKRTSDLQKPSLTKLLQ